MNIIEAIDDPALFAPWFPGNTWNPWRTVLKGAFGLPMSSDEAAFFRSVADRDPPTEQASELWIIAGRRAGKDSIASVIAAHAAALFQDNGRLRPGERPLVACLASDRDQARIVLNYCRAFFTDVPLLQGMVERETAYGFELNNMVDISVSTSNFRAVRGRPILCAVLDECAFWRDENSATPDVETYNAIKPGLATMPGSMIVGISSPYKKSGLLHRKFKDNFGKPGKVLVVRAPTELLNPTIDPQIIADALAEDPAAAKAEWMAEFRDDVGGWADAALIEKAVEYGVTVRPPRAGIVYRSFCDPSGGAKDSFTAAVAHCENGESILDCLVEIKAPFNPTDATRQIADVLKSYGQTTTFGDKYAAQWTVDAFARCGITYRHSDRDRSSIYLDVLPLFTSGRCRLLDNRRLVTQFAALERRTSSVGKDRVDHGPGGKDDCCNSAAAALVLAQPRTAQQLPDLGMPVQVGTGGLSVPSIGSPGGGNYDEFNTPGATNCIW
ncbi:hypothetical protein JQ615_18375 [Bradyrhizobium jicamae]|uniref:Terminase n=1 Tax=Bradyrhizobium jicamae TaxID=280332 RepID=A0ABS5FKN7_9BRAD|nr:hypothetical protein [Bradyrhizobium jicamae]MBR0797357.1 hypothetical protein [Bradyrhizobium jicamae]